MALEWGKWWITEGSLHTMQNECAVPNVGVIKQKHPGGRQLTRRLPCGEIDVGEYTTMDGTSQTWEKSGADQSWNFRCEPKLVETLKILRLCAIKISLMGDVFPVYVGDRDTMNDQGEMNSLVKCFPNVHRFDRKTQGPWCQVTNRG